MKITAESNLTKELKEYDLDELIITGNFSEESEVTVSALKTESFANIYTSDNSYLTKFKKHIESNPDVWKITRVVERRDGTVSGVMLQVPKRCLSFRVGKEVELSEERRRAMFERFKKNN